MRAIVGTDYVVLSAFRDRKPRFVLGFFNFTQDSFYINIRTYTITTYCKY